MKVRALLTALGVLSVAACTPLQSNIGLNSDRSLRGVAYMVPTQRVSLTATRTDSRPVKMDKALTNWVKAETQLGAANTELKLAKEVLKEAERELEAYTTTGSDDAHEKKLKLAKELAEVAVNRATEAQKTASKAALTTRAYVEKLERERVVPGTTSEPRWAETLKLVASLPIGDPNLQFAASPNFNALRSDEGKLTIANGLLQSANVTASGEVDEILVSAFRAAAVLSLGVPDLGGLKANQIFSLGTETKVVTPPTDPLPVDECVSNDPATFAIPPKYILRPNTLTLSFDPSNPSEIIEANTALCQSGYSLRLRVGSNENSPAANGNAAANGTAAASDTRSDLSLDHAAALDSLCRSVKTLSCPGLVYRTPQPFVFRVVEVNENREPYVRHQQTLSLVSGAPLRLLEYEASPFTTVSNDAEFQAGVLVSYEYDRPGAVDEIVNIPFRAVSAATEAVSTLVQLRLNITDDAKDIQKLEAEIANLASTESAANELSIAEQQLEMLKVQKEILEIQADIDALNQTGDTP